jgi:hypothetical protein
MNRLISRFGLTRIKIPLQKFRDAAQVMSQSDIRNGLDFQLSPFLEAISMDEKAKKKKIMDLRDGWVDLTEVN